MYENLISAIPFLFIVFVFLSFLLTTINFWFVKLIVKLKALLFDEGFFKYFLRSLKLLFIVCFILTSLIFIPILQILLYGMFFLFQYLPYVLFVFIIINIIYLIIMKDSINRFINLLNLESSLIISSIIIRLIAGFLA